MALYKTVITVTISLQVMLQLLPETQPWSRRIFSWSACEAGRGLSLFLSSNRDSGACFTRRRS